MRAPAFLAEQRVVFETIVHPPAFTAQKRARSLRVSGSHVAKSVLLHGPRGYLLAVLPATQQVDTDALAQGLVDLAERIEIIAERLETPHIHS